MLFSRACEYGIRAMLYLATKPGKHPVQVRDIAEHLKMPFPFLAKIVQSLARQGLLISQKGPGGGVRLGKAPSEATLLEVVEAIDGLDLTRTCAMGIPRCSEDEPCPLHASWARIREDVVEMLSSQSLAEAAEMLRNRQFVLVRTPG